MRIYGPNGSAAAAAPKVARRAGTGGAFNVSETEGGAAPVAAGALRSVTNLDALMAMQGVEDPAERRKRAVRHGRNALDVLDALKLGLLDGNIDTSMLGRLKVMAEGLKQGTGEAGLDAVLGEINLRVEVELAKAGVR